MPALTSLLAAVAALGLAGVFLLHVLEPALRFTWSFAGLGRDPLLPWLALTFVLVLPPLTARAWRAEAARRLMPAFGARAAIRGAALLWIVLSALGVAFPAPDVCPDVLYLKSALVSSVPGTPAYLLTVPLLRLLHAPFAAALEPATFLRIVNALFSAASIVCTAAIARRVGGTWRGAAAVFLLVWSAFGSLQLALGYVDIYPLAQLLVALYVWTALRFLQDDASLAWPIAVACVAPFFYIVLGLLAPSMLVLAVVAYRARGGLRRLTLASLGGAVLASAATVPRYGQPAAVLTLMADIDERGKAVPGLAPDTYRLPFAYMLTLDHVLEVLHALLLLDPSGLVLGATLVPLALARPTRATILLAAIVAPSLFFMFTVDPLWGPYADWDLFSHMTLPLTLLVACGFLSFAQLREALAPWLLGLALAVSCTHLAARLSSLDVHFDRHMAESPYHIRNLPPGLFRPR